MLPQVWRASHHARGGPRDRGVCKPTLTRGPHRTRAPPGSPAPRGPRVAYRASGPPPCGSRDPRPPPARVSRAASGSAPAGVPNQDPGSRPLGANPPRPARIGFYGSRGRGLRARLLRACSEGSN